MLAITLDVTVHRIQRENGVGLVMNRYNESDRVFAQNAFKS